MLHVSADALRCMDQQLGLDIRWYAFFFRLITDFGEQSVAAIHMGFDCMAIGMGLLASVMATWPPNERFTYG